MSHSEDEKKREIMLDNHLDNDVTGEKGDSLGYFNTANADENHAVATAVIKGELALQAIDTLRMVMKSRKAKASDKVNAARAILSFGGFGQKGNDSTHDKAISEMSASEIQNQLNALREEASKRAKPVIDMENTEDRGIETIEDLL